MVEQRGFRGHFLGKRLSVMAAVIKNLSHKSKETDKILDLGGTTV